jgi:hypothetical protein
MTMQEVTRAMCFCAKAINLEAFTNATTGCTYQGTQCEWKKRKAQRDIIWGDQTRLTTTWCGKFLAPHRAVHTNDSSRQAI